MNHSETNSDPPSSLPSPPTSSLPAEMVTAPPFNSATMPQQQQLSASVAQSLLRILQQQQQAARYAATAPLTFTQIPTHLFVQQTPLQHIQPIYLTPQTSNHSTTPIAFPIQQQPTSAQFPAIISPIAILQATSPSHPSTNPSSSIITTATPALSVNSAATSFSSPSRIHSATTLNSTSHLGARLFHQMDAKHHHCEDQPHSSKKQKLCTICTKQSLAEPLSDALLACVFQFLGMRKILGTVQRVCKRFQHVVVTQKFLWKSIGFDMREDPGSSLNNRVRQEVQPHEQPYQLVARQAFSSNMLLFSPPAVVNTSNNEQNGSSAKNYTSGKEKHHITDQQLNYYIELAGKYWTKVYLTHLDPTINYCFHHIVEHSNNTLKELCIDSPLISLQNIYSFLYSCKLLEKVKITRKRPNNTMQNLKTPLHEHNQGYQVQHLLDEQLQLPNLKSLHWEDVNILENEKAELCHFLEWLPKTTPNLKSINFRIDKRIITNSILMKIGDHCKLLEEFSYFEYTRKRLYESIDDGVVYLIQHCAQLTSLDFESVMSITFVIIPAILQHRSKLKKLRIWWCENLHHNVDQVLRSVDFTSLSPMENLQEFKFCILEVNHYLWELLLNRFLTNQLKICSLSGFDITFSHIHANKFGKNLIEMDIHPVQNLDDNFITQLLVHSPNLQALKIGYRDIDELNVLITDATLSAIANYGKNLKQLFLSGCGFKSDFVSILCKKENTLPNLEQFTILNCYSEEILSSAFDFKAPLPSLKKLVMDLTLTESQIPKLCQAFPSLEYLCLKSAPSSGKFFTFISKYLLHLKTLDTVYSSNMNYDFQMSELKSMRKVIIRGYDLNLDSFFTILACAPFLNHFACTKLPFTYRDENMPKYLQELNQMKQISKLQTAILHQTASLSPQQLSHHQVFRALITAMISKTFEKHILGKTPEQMKHLINTMSHLNYVIHLPSGKSNQVQDEEDLHNMTEFTSLSSLTHHFNHTHHQ